MPTRMRLTIRRPLATAATAALPAALPAPAANAHPAPRQSEPVHSRADALGPPADTPTLTVDLARSSARVPFTGGTAAFVETGAGTATAAPAPAPPDGVSAPHRTHRVPTGGR